jgi:hypothetical protein
MTGVAMIERGEFVTDLRQAVTARRAFVAAEDMRTDGGASG